VDTLNFQWRRHDLDSGLSEAAVKGVPGSAASRTAYAVTEAGNVLWSRRSRETAISKKRLFQLDGNNHPPGLAR